MTGRPILTPAEHYREATLLVEGRFDDCRDCPPDCGHERSRVAAAAVHAALANAPEGVAAAAMQGDAFVKPWTGEGALGTREQIIHDDQAGARTIDLQSRVACALDLLAGPAWPPVNCAASASWAEIVDLVVRALTRENYPHWVATHDGWPGSPPIPANAAGVVTVSAKDLLDVVTAIVEDRPASDQEIAAARRLRAGFGEEDPANGG